MHCLFKDSVDKCSVIDQTHLCDFSPCLQRRMYDPISHAISQVHQSTILVQSKSKNTSDTSQEQAFLTILYLCLVMSHASFLHSCSVSTESYTLLGRHSAVYYPPYTTSSGLLSLHLEKQGGNWSELITLPAQVQSFQD